MQQVIELARSARNVVVLTGAGMSAESGVATFRDAETGLWANRDPMKLASAEAWDDDPALVWAWYRWRFGILHSVEPHAGHYALARWAERPGVGLNIVTQNIDDLHERAGTPVLSHLHGNIAALRCSRCDAPAEDTQPLPTQEVPRLTPPLCARCGGFIRPGVVWFGEALPQDAFTRAEDAVVGADLVLVVGTSGLVYPAASLPFLALNEGIPVVEIGPDDTEFTDHADVAWREKAGPALTQLVNAL